MPVRLTYLIVTIIIIIESFLVLPGAKLLPTKVMARPRLQNPFRRKDKSLKDYAPRTATSPTLVCSAPKTR